MDLLLSPSGYYLQPCHGQHCRESLGVNQKCPPNKRSGRHLLFGSPLDIQVIWSAEPLSLYIFSSQDRYQSRYAGELQISCFGLDSTTTSADHLLEQTHTPDRVDIEANLRASYVDGFFDIIIACSLKCFTAVPLKSLTK